MAQETPNPLPFSETTHTTLAAAIEARQLLADQLLPELARPITSLSYNPWIAKRRDDKQEYEAEPQVWGFIHDYSVAAAYLFTEPIPTGLKMVTPKRIIFQTRAADQGWATFGGEGTFENSHTWFEASILRPRDAHHDGAHVAPEGILRETWWGAPGARDDLKEHGWDFVEGEDGQLTWTVCNNLTASSEFRNYRVEWERGVVPDVDDEDAVGTGEGFLELLRPGCIVVLWARAEQAHWVNKVEAATIEIEYDFL
ncbi:hypothetical protein NW754_007631 [Fusarium falciforme]|uniref:Uncharacterized protein n=1 Tax=Fusarium falciforme TaxID=195108 RepID=A0A9W8R3A7_9HYPO|nr:hypothetical protein NW754_007631 [Fusarium falciforme]KAJ4186488.1 hypothetical protein NW755_007783 [Fusarium falciforme]